MRRMIASDIASKLAVKNGRIGTMVDEGSFKRGTYPATEITGKTILVSGITGIGTGWTFAAGPFDYSSFEDGTLTLYTNNDFGYANYVVRIGTDIYEIANAGVTGTFIGSNLVVEPVELHYGEVLTVGNVFKAFKLED